MFKRFWTWTFLKILKGSFTIINVTFCLLIADKVAPTHSPPSCLLFWCFVTLGVYLRVFTHGIPFIITCVYLDDSLDIFWLCILYKIIEKHTKLSYIFHFSSQNLQDYHIFFQFLLRIYPLLTINSMKLSVFNVFYPFAIKTLTKKLLQLNEMQKKH